MKTKVRLVIEFQVDSEVFELHNIGMLAKKVFEAAADTLAYSSHSDRIDPMKHEVYIEEEL